MSGRTLDRSRYPRPSRSMTPGLKFSAVRSLTLTSSLASRPPASGFRLSSTDFLFLLSSSARLDFTPTRRAGVDARWVPPRTFVSILMTSARSMAHSSQQYPPTPAQVKSATRTPASGPSTATPPFVLDHAGAGEGFDV